MLNVKVVSVLVAVGLCTTSMAVAPTDFEFPINQLEKADDKTQAPPQELGFIAKYRLLATHAAVGAATFAIGYVLAYQIHAGNFVVAAATKGTPKQARARSRVRTPRTK